MNLCCIVSNSIANCWVQFRYNLICSLDRQIALIWTLVDEMNEVLPEIDQIAENLEKWVISVLDHALYKNDWVLITILNHFLAGIEAKLC